MDELQHIMRTRTSAAGLCNSHGQFNGRWCPGCAQQAAVREHQNLPKMFIKQSAAEPDPVWVPPKCNVAAAVDRAFESNHAAAQHSWA